MKSQYSRLVALGTLLASLVALFFLGRPCGGGMCQRNQVTLNDYLRLGIQETEHYRFSEAARWLEHARRMAPGSAEPLVALGKYFFRRQDYVRAIDSFIAAARLSPSDWEALHYAGLLRKRMRTARPEGTMFFFQRSYEMNPENYAGLSEWAKLTAITQGKTAALALVMPRLRHEHRNPGLLWVVGEVHAAVGEHQEAVKWYQSALALTPRDGAIKISLGHSWRALGYPARAVAEYWLAGLIHPVYTEGFFDAAATMLEAGDVVQAEEMARYLLQIAPDYPGAHAMLARIYKAGNRHDLAVEAMQTEAERHPENISVKVDLAEAYISVGRFEEALGALKQVTAVPLDSIREPQYVNAWVRGHAVLSKAYRGLKRYDAAEKEARIASRIDGHSVFIQREMAYAKAGLDFGN